MESGLPSSVSTYNILYISTFIYPCSSGHDSTEQSVAKMNIRNKYPLQHTHTHIQTLNRKSQEFILLSEAVRKNTNVVKGSVYAERDQVRAAILQW